MMPMPLRHGVSAPIIGVEGRARTRPSDFTASEPPHFDGQSCAVLSDGYRNRDPYHRGFSPFGGHGTAAQSRREVPTLPAAPLTRRFASCPSNQSRQLSSILPPHGAP
jgi:hypothetical protein